jgi:hypothetical protein
LRKHGPIKTKSKYHKDCSIMSNVLVIEPRKLLQHATAIALFPDHEARIVAAIPEAALVNEYNAVILDAVALREISALSGPALRAMDDWTVPMVWIDGDAPQAPNAVNLVVVKRPVSRDELRAALATCLGRELMLRPTAEAAQQQGAPSPGKIIRQKAAAAPAPAPRVIDLVEVVEQAAPAQRKEKK